MSSFKEKYEEKISELTALKRKYDDGDESPELYSQIHDALSEVEAMSILMRMPNERKVVMPDGPVAGDKFKDSPGEFKMRGPGADKSYRSLFGSNSSGAKKWEDNSIGFFSAVHSGRHHPELTTRTMSETIPSDGGYLVPSETAREIHAVSLENEIVQPRANVVPMMSNEKHLPGLQIGDHSSNLFGGFTAAYKDELSELDQANPKTRDVMLRAWKLTGLVSYSAELAADTPNFEDSIKIACGKGLSWYRDKSFLTGSGAGKPMGILNSPCLIEQAKEAGQTADTITYPNLTKMLSRLWPGSFDKAVWVASPSTIPQLLSLSITVGDAGSHYPVLSESSGQWKMLTRPVIFSEKMAILGDKFDLLLADFSQYIVGLRAGMRYDLSPHVDFKKDQIWGRLIERHDGMALWSEALTLQDGTSTVSPFVTLAERA